jgi:hypothetical protein
MLHPGCWRQLLAVAETISLSRRMKQWASGGEKRRSKCPGFLLSASTLTFDWGVWWRPSILIASILASEADVVRELAPGSPASAWGPKESRIHEVKPAGLFGWMWPSLGA